MTDSPDNIISQFPSRSWRSDRCHEILNLSRPMAYALREAAESGHIGPVSAGTRRAIVARRLSDAEGYLNAFGKTIALTLLPLTNQCRLMDVPYIEYETAWTERPELAALMLLCKDDEHGHADEGAMLRALIHALVLPRLNRVATTVWGNAEQARSFLYMHYASYAHFLDHEHSLAQNMPDDIRTRDKNAFFKSWRTLRDWNQLFKTHPAAHVETERAWETLNWIKEHTLVDIFQQVQSEHIFFGGWPDLMIVGQNAGIRFREIKTSDKLHYRQILTILQMKDFAKLDIAVVRLKRSK